MRWITALLAATLFVGCSNDTVDDTDVNPDVIWGKYETRFMAPGDTVRIEMRDKDGHSIFGTIDQKVVQA